MDPIDKETKARLASGDANGVPMTVEEQHADGVVIVRKTDGKRMFLPKVFVDLVRYRNRGKD